MTIQSSAHDQQNGRLLLSLAQYVVAAGIALLPLSWFVLHRGADFSLKPVHLQQVILGALALLLAPALFRGLRTLLKFNPLFWIAYTTYALSLFALALPLNPTGSASLVKALLSFGVALVTAAFVAALPPERVMRALWYGGLGGLVLFLLGAEASLNMLGESYISRVITAIRTSNVNELLFGIHKRMLNALAPHDGVTIGTSLRNTVASGVVVIFVVLNMVKPGVARLGPVSRALRFGAVCASVVLLVALLSRSALLSAGLAVACYVLLRTLGRNVRGLELLVGLSICVVIGLVGQVISGRALQRV